MIAGRRFSREPGTRRGFFDGFFDDVLAYEIGEVIVFNEIIEILVIVIIIDIVLVFSPGFEYATVILVVIASVIDPPTAIVFNVATGTDTTQRLQHRRVDVIELGPG